MSIGNGFVVNFRSVPSLNRIETEENFYVVYVIFGVCKNQKQGETRKINKSTLILSVTDVHHERHATIDSIESHERTLLTARQKS